MAPIATHLSTARVTVSTMAEHVNGLHEQLGQLYLLLSRPLEEKTRAEALGLAHNVMADLRSLSERSDYLKLSIRGVESDISAGFESMRKLLLGPSIADYAEKAHASDTMPHRPYEVDPSKIDW